MIACVVGLGKIGLPLAVQIASRGIPVVGVDIDEDVVELVNRGEVPFPGETDLAERLDAVVSAGTLSAGVDTARAVPSADVVVVVVPLIVDDSGSPDFGAMDAATEAVGTALTVGTLVSYETTLPVGTTRDRFTPALERHSQLRSGEDFFVCHSPERVFSGRIFQDLRRYPKLVGGVDVEAGLRAAAFYEAALEFDDRPDLPRPNGVWDLGSVEAAELAKLAETTYRDINIAFANELARFAERIGIDIGKVIDAANSQPFSHVHRPGVAVGGHCIPVYPHFLLDGAPEMRLPRLARDVNSSMPGHVVDRVRAAIGGLQDRAVAVLGAAYRGDVKETAFSGVFPLVEAIERHGARALVHDPLYSDSELEALGFNVFHLGDACDAVILQADHRTYVSLSPSDVPGAEVLVDGRGAIDPERFVDAATSYLRVGVGPELER